MGRVLALGSGEVSDPPLSSPHMFLCRLPLSWASGALMLLEAARKERVA